MEPTLLQLRCFDAVARERHFGRAALALGLSQPQVSRHLASLERELGVTLVQRTSRQVALTDGGAELLADAREALAAAQRLSRRAQGVGRGGLGAVAVGFIWSTLGGYLAPLVAAAGERHRHVELSVSQLRFTEVLPALRRGEVDLLVTRAFGEAGELIVTRLNREPTVVAIPEGHALAACERVTVAQLHGEPLITLARTTIPSIYDAAHEALGDAGVVPSSLRGATSQPEALAFVAAGLGIYFRLPQTAVAAQPGVAFRELVDAPMSTLLVRRPEPPSPAVAAIVALAVELFGDATNASNDERAALDSGPPTA